MYLSATVREEETAKHFHRHKFANRFRKWYLNVDIFDGVLLKLEIPVSYLRPEVMHRFLPVVLYQNIWFF